MSICIEPFQSPAKILLLIPWLLAQPPFTSADEVAIWDVVWYDGAQFIVTATTDPEMHFPTLEALSETRSVLCAMQPILCGICLLNHSEEPLSELDWIPVTGLNSIPWRPCRRISQRCQLLSHISIPCVFVEEHELRIGLKSACQRQYIIKKACKSLVFLLWSWRSFMYSANFRVGSKTSKASASKPSFRPPEIIPSIFQPPAPATSPRIQHPVDCSVVANARAPPSNSVHEPWLQIWRYACPGFPKRNYWQSPICGLRYYLKLFSF